MSPLTPSSAEPPVSAPTPENVPSVGSRKMGRIVSGLLLLCGCGIVIGGMIAIVLVHTAGMGKLIGFMIVVGLALAVSGWTRIKS